VRGTAISGNMLELFSKIETVGADLRFIGRVGAPSLLISEMEISGAN
jgi:PmbA protein